MLLQEQIDKLSKSIKTDSYSMSIGEIANMYRDSDIIINPNYQRLFRWDITQQSNFIESILLGIPLPPIYVYQNEDGTWNLIDGLQRLSTLFKFMGLLTDFPSEPLIETKFLSKLEGKKWSESSNDGINSLTEAQRRFIKRAKIMIIIIDKASDGFAQYEMFQRLNTGGTQLSEQEIRNCILIMKDEDKFEHLQELSQDIHFKNTLPLSNKDLDAQGLMEMIVKYFVIMHSDFNVRQSENFHDFLTNEIISILDNTDINFENEIERFKTTFKLIDDLLGESAFKSYDAETGRFTGKVLVGAYEAILSGLKNNLDYYLQNKQLLETKIKDMYREPKFIETKGQGIRAVARIKILHTFGQEYYGEITGCTNES